MLSPQFNPRVHRRRFFIATAAATLSVLAFSSWEFAATRDTSVPTPTLAQSLNSGPASPQDATAKGAGSTVDVTGSAEARVLFDAAQVMLQQGEARPALDMFQRAVDKDPSFAEAWMALGSAHVSLHDVDEGIDEMKRAIALNPKNPLYYKVLAVALGGTGRLEEALDGWFRLRQITPDDPDAPKQIVAILGAMGRFAEAIADLELITSRPGGAPYLVELAVAYSRVGQKDKATATFEQAARLDSSVATLNTVAYSMIEEHLALDVALSYGEQAVHKQENETTSISLQQLTDDELGGMAELGGDWDTVGWTHFAMNHLEPAEKYLKAAWNLYESPTIGDHLAQIYEKEGKKQEAIKTYAQVVVQGNAPEESMEHLTALMGDARLAGSAVDEARANFGQLHNISVDYQTDDSARGAFYLLFRKGAGIVDVKFIKGSESLRESGSAIRRAEFALLFPDDAATQIIRRGILACHPGASHCELMLIPPDAVQSVQ
jgi:tetratricopeptide (TPR) repeat protein